MSKGWGSRDNNKLRSSSCSEIEWVVGLKQLLELRGRKDTCWVLGRGEFSLENFCRQSGGNIPDLRFTKLQREQCQLEDEGGSGPRMDKDTVFSSIYVSEETSSTLRG